MMGSGPSMQTEHLSAALHRMSWPLANVFSRIGVAGLAGCKLQEQEPAAAAGILHSDVT